jgi:hypothetical protein
LSRPVQVGPGQGELPGNWDQSWSTHGIVNPSSQLAIAKQVQAQHRCQIGQRPQSLSPLRRHPQNNSLQFRRARHYHRTAGSVLTVCVTRGNKRAVRLSLEDFDGVREFNVDELRGIDLALEELHEYDAHLAHLVELKYFCGLTDDEIGKAQHMSFAQVRRDWECARAWLRKKFA